MTDCCFLSTPYSNSLCIISFPVQMKRECNYILPTVLFSTPPKNVLHHALCIVDGFRCRGCIECRKLLFLYDLSQRWLCLRAASVHLRGLIKLPVYCLEANCLVLDVNNSMNHISSFFLHFPSSGL